MNPAMLFMLLALVAMMWLSTSRQRKVARERQAFRSSLQAGDRVMTSSGLHATVVSLDDATQTAVLDAGHGPMTWSRDAIAKRIDVPLTEIPPTSVDGSPAE